MDLALIGNCSFQALIDSHARVQWLCWPRFDSSFVVGPLLDREKGGEFSVTPVADGFYSEQRYVENTAILETIWSRAGESFSVTDFAPRTRTPEGIERPRALIRKIQPLEGAPKVRMGYRAVYDYGRAAPPDGALHLQCSEGIRPGQAFGLSSTVYVVLSWESPLSGSLAAECERLLADTKDYWQSWVRSLRVPTHSSAEVVRSAITLELHQYEDTGAITAATTTSITEHAGSGRTWDYRFCWPRDSYFTVDALHQLGRHEVGKRYVDYLLGIAARDAGFQPLYGIGGERRVDEEILEHLAGYRGDGPVRIGNLAYTQLQHDIYGEMICAVAPVYLQGPSEPLRALLMRLLTEIEEHFEEPDAGLWEKRDEPARHTFSLLMHWIGGRAAAELGAALDDAELAGRGEAIMGRARACMDDLCWNEEHGFYTETVGGRHADASLLFMIGVGYLPATDPRARRHLRALCARLEGEHGLFRRYAHDDGLGETLSSFTVCTLWYAEALALLGEYEESERVLRSVLSRTNHVGLLSEDIDPRDGSLWGNFPQTYSHVGIIRCALALSRAGSSSSH